MFKIRNEFPMLVNNKDLVYLDSAALGLKPKSVISAGIDFYEKYSISTRTSDSKIGTFNVQKIDETRQNVAAFINAKEEEIIFTSGATDSLNLIAKMLSEIIKDGEILISYFNHSSNIIPYIELFSKNKNIEIKYFSTQDELLSLINKKTKIVALSQITNNFNINYDLDVIYKKCKGTKTILINDAAQAISHQQVSLQNCDVVAFSANKLFGPTGVGILAIKNNLKNNLTPSKWGGGQVHDINFCSWTANNTNAKFEPGTANLAGIFQLNEAIKFVKKIGYENIYKHEKKIANYLYDNLSKLNNVEIASSRGDIITLFNVKNVSSQDVASYLGNEKNIYVRSGKFCAQMVSKLKKYKESYVRVSISIYNDKKDIDKLIDALAKGGNFIEFIFK